MRRSRRISGQESRESPASQGESASKPEAANPPPSTPAGSPCEITAPRGWQPRRNDDDGGGGGGDAGVGRMARMVAMFEVDRRTLRLPHPFVISTESSVSIRIICWKRSLSYHSPSSNGEEHCFTTNGLAPVNHHSTMLAALRTIYELGPNAASILRCIKDPT
uniref:Uncharacterized protein n=1 Tax=Vespula pensylvanica TaxID=30213 RepID=A0A834P0I8_VESPE|nr:hypothetical protein H0235_008643 [Vespula pensylvanica]